MMGSACRRHVSGCSSRIAEESPRPFLLDEVVHLATQLSMVMGFPVCFSMP